MKNSRYWIVAVVFVALLLLGGTQSAWASPDLQTVPTFTPTPSARETPNPDRVVDAPSGSLLNFGTFKAGALGCAGFTVNISEVHGITSSPGVGYNMLQTPVSVVACSELAQVVACFPVNLAKYPYAQIWLYDPASTLWTVAPVFIGEDDMLCGYTFGSGIFAPWTP